MVSSIAITIFSFLLGGLASFCATLIAERLKRPLLEFELGVPNDVVYQPARHATHARYIDIRVRNAHLPKFFHWLNREAAMFCNGYIKFKVQSGTDVFQTPMPIRWAGTPEPVPMTVQIGAAIGQIFDQYRFFLEQKVDIPVGESRTMNVVAQFDSDPECYGWSNESYLSNPRWRNPNRRLQQGSYRIEVTILHLGGSATFSCGLQNQGGKAVLTR